jgi:hypothetical protein
MSDRHCNKCGTLLSHRETEMCLACQAQSELSPAPGSTVPFAEANLDRLEKATLTDGIIVECGENRRVEVWRVKEEEGYAIRIFRPTNDGKTSKLLFGLKPSAAQALCLALSKHLSNAAGEPQPPANQKR